MNSKLLFHKVPINVKFQAAQDQRIYDTQPVRIPTPTTQYFMKLIILIVKYCFIKRLSMWSSWPEDFQHMMTFHCQNTSPDNSILLHNAPINVKLLQAAQTDRLEDFWCMMTFHCQNPSLNNSIRDHINH